MDFDIMGQAAKIVATSIFAHTEKANFNQLLPKFGLTYKFNDGSNIYATVTKGYRAGGFNVQMFGDIIQSDVQSGLQGVMQSAMQSRQDIMIVERVPTEKVYASLLDGIKFKPEESWNYELGTHLNLFGGSTHLDLSLYYMQIRNQQLSVMMPGSNYGRIMVNAGKSHSCGVEATLRGRAFDNAFDWGVTYAFTNAKFDEYDTYNDNYVPFVPQHTFSAMADYHFGNFTIGVNLAGQGKTWWDEANTFSQKLYATLGAHADYDFGPVLVSLWGRNITNTNYNTFAIASSAVGGTHYFAQKATPIQVGADVRIHF
jgi:outer membrane receptor protein involved in Fe transport